MGILDGPNNRILKADTKVQDVLEALAEYVDHHGKNISRVVPVRQIPGSDYWEWKPVNNNQVHTAKVDGVEFGYRLEDHQVFMRRVVYMKVPGYRISDISEDERTRIMTALFNVFFLPGGKVPEARQIAPDCLLFVHDFVPDILVEQKPGLVSIAGGWEKPN